MADSEGFKRPEMPFGGKAPPPPYQHVQTPVRKSGRENGGQVVAYGGQQLMATGIAGADQIPRTSRLPAPIMLYTGHEGEIMTARFSTDGSIFASAGYDQKIFLWNVYDEGENFATLKGHTGTVMDLHFNTDSSALFTCSTDKTVRIWDMETGTCKRKFKSHLEIVNSCHPARRGPQLVASASDDGFVLVHDLRLRDPVKKFENRFAQTAVSFNDTAEYVFAGNIENDIVCYDMRKGEADFTLEHHMDTITSLALSPDGSYLLSNSMDQTLLMFDVRPYCEGDRLNSIFRGHEHNFERNLLKCTWSPDGQWVSAGSADRFVYVWDIDTGRIAYKLPGHQGSVVATDFHPKEPILLSSGTDKRIYLGELSEYFKN
ncbi:unnamed protein product, partial [Mesorhabditis belari]|uniref:Uncharacterized protein n=1 Tax=Mesorhabditis belari TaxID=2138241 RepID=A0AAF3FRY8_9BILA